MASGRPQVNRGYSAPSFAQGSRTPSTSSSLTSSDFSYFSPHAPSTAASPSTSTLPSPAIPNSPTTYPIITATVTSRHGGSTSTTTSSLHDQDPLRQFALHIPNPPRLSLSTPSRQSGPEVQSPSYHHQSHHGAATPGYEDLPSPMDRSRRMPPSSQTPQMNISSSMYKYMLSVRLPAAIQPEMVTVCANKGDKIKVVADVWHMENESHYEWQIIFPPHDIDMSAVQARFDADKTLTIDVRRIPRVHYS